MSRRTSAVNWVQLSNWREEEQMNLPLMDLMLERVKSLDFVSVTITQAVTETLPEVVRCEESRPHSSDPQRRNQIKKNEAHISKVLLMCQKRLS
ncbi:unnamed protein product [Brassica oleracea var. botrytis]